METSKILSADLLDLIFDDRNKEYGAYELRKTYQHRIKQSIIITFTLTAVIIGGSVLASSLKPEKDYRDDNRVVVVDLIPETPEPEKLPEPEKQPEPEPVQTEQLSTIRMADVVDEPMATQDELEDSKIGLEDVEGPKYDGTTEEPAPVDTKGIIDSKPTEDPDAIAPIVDIKAKYSGHWEKFLLRHLNGNVPVDNGAPIGRYTVTVQFIVDKEGNVSEIKATSNAGYGMEEEAVRVLRKADKWSPAIYNGYKVKAYHTQTIIFEVNSEE